MQTNDEVLWQIAKKRASFKKQLAAYVLVNGFLWMTWVFSRAQHNNFTFGLNSFPWPVWVMFWWGVGLTFNFINAYVVNTKDAIQKEFQKLKNQQ